MMRDTRYLLLAALLFAPVAVYCQTAPDHVPPAPPREVMGDMTYKDMVSMMQMDDTHPFGKVMLDQFEWRDTKEGGAAAWDAQGWYGGDYNKLWVKTEGERIQASHFLLYVSMPSTRSMGSRHCRQTRASLSVT